MKKIFSFFAAALLSVSLFAAPEKVPAVSDLAASFDVQNNVVLACYFDEPVCNDVYLVGSYSGWAESFENCEKFVALAGFDGWYVVEVSFAEDLQAKPIQAKSDGGFSWDYQTGAADAWINLGGEGTQTANVTAGYSDEANVAYPAAGAYIYEIAYFKKHNSPCVFVPSHKYTIMLYPPTCEGEDFKPGIAGAFNGWPTPATPMNEELDDDFNTVYTYVIEDEEGHEFKFREVTDESQNWDNQLQHYDEESGSWKNFDNISLPVATKDTTLIFDYSDGTKYRYGLCGADDTVYEVTVTVTVPAGAPEAGVEIVGSFNGWPNELDENALMTKGENNVYTVTVNAKGTDQFKFREAGTWANEIVDLTNLDEDLNPKGLDNMNFADKWDENHAIVLDFSDAEKYAWKVAASLENIVLTESAQKIMVDGHVYIIRDNKLFNVIGTQVR